MLNILESPAKIVFIMIAATACFGLFVGVITSENFMVLASSCFAFFFSYKGSDKTESTNTQPFAGK